MSVGLGHDLDTGHDTPVPVPLKTSAKLSLTALVTAIGQVGYVDNNSSDLDVWHDGSP